MALLPPNQRRQSTEGILVFNANIISKCCEGLSERRATTRSVRWPKSARTVRLGLYTWFCETFALAWRVRYCAVQVYGSNYGTNHTARHLLTEHLVAVDMGAPRKGQGGSHDPPGFRHKFFPYHYLAPRVEIQMHFWKGAKFAGSVGHPTTKMLSASGGFAPLTSWPGALPLDPAGGSAPRPPL